MPFLLAIAVYAIYVARAPLDKRLKKRHVRRVLRGRRSPVPERGDRLSSMEAIADARLEIVPTAELTLEEERAGGAR